MLNNGINSDNESRIQRLAIKGLLTLYTVFSITVFII